MFAWMFGCPAWLTLEYQQSNTLVFTETIVDSYCYFKSGEVGELIEVTGEIGLVRSELQDFIEDLLCIEGVCCVSLDGNCIRINSNLEHTYVVKDELRKRVQRLVDATWNVVDVDTTTYDELEFALTEVIPREDEWADIVYTEDRPA